MPDDSATSLPLTVLNPDHDWKRPCGVCKEIITKGQEGIEVTRIHLPIGPLGESSLLVYLVWHDDCQERHLEAGESCGPP